MILSAHQPQYIPWLGFFDKIAKSDAFVFLDSVQYKPREFQNRNKIRTKSGSVWLTVPVISSRFEGRQRICDCAIDNSFPWRRQHLRSLEIWYSKAEFAKSYLGFFKDVYAGNWEKLAGLNTHIINYMLKQFEIERPIYFESELGTKSTKTGRIIELCRKLGADTYLSGAGGRDYLDEGMFVQQGIKLAYQEFRHPIYHQQFASAEAEFIPYMSALDLLLNVGPKAFEILLDPKTRRLP